MDEEMNALTRNETWDLVPKPKDVDLITCKCVYKIKWKADGSVDIRQGWLLRGSLKIWRRL